METVPFPLTEMKSPFPIFTLEPTVVSSSLKSLWSLVIWFVQPLLINHESHELLLVAKHFATKIDLLRAAQWISLPHLILTYILSLHVPCCHIFCTWHQASTGIIIEDGLSFYSVHMVKYHHFACFYCLLLDFLLSHRKHLLWTPLLSLFTFVLVLAMHSPILPRKCSTNILFLLMKKFFIHFSQAHKPNFFASFFHQKNHYPVISPVLVIFEYQSIDWFWTFNLWTFYFYFWEGKKRKKPLREFGSGGWFRGGNVLSTLHDYGTP